jgi:UDP:flavonoid glycosyltransferase YjiC (YdhE family)
MKFSALNTDSLTERLATLLADRTASRAQELAASMTPPADAVRASADIVERAFTTSDM